MFREFLSGKGLRSIANGLTQDDILSPSGHDPGRNSHRTSSKNAWAMSAVRGFIANPPLHRPPNLEQATQRRDPHQCR
ncbi:MAG: recombinase family protein [Acidimicrobiales bacterium]